MYACVQLSANHIRRYFTYFNVVFSRIARFCCRVLVMRVQTLISRLALSLPKKIREYTANVNLFVSMHLNIFFFHFCVLAGKTRTRAVISHLVEAYWDPLWDWLVGDREGIFRSSEVRDFLEQQNIRTLNKDLRCNQMQAYSLNVIAKKSLQTLALTFSNLRQNSLKKIPNSLTVTSSPIFLLLFSFFILPFSCSLFVPHFMNY